MTSNFRTSAWIRPSLFLRCAFTPFRPSCKIGPEPEVAEQVDCERTEVFEDTIFRHWVALGLSSACRRLLLVYRVRTSPHSSPEAKLARRQTLQETLTIQALSP